MPCLREFLTARAVSSLCLVLAGCATDTESGPDESPGGPSIEGLGGMGGGRIDGSANGGAMEDPSSSELSCPESTSGFASEAIAHSFGEGQDFGQDRFPELVLGGPTGGGLSQGSLDVVALGDGGWVTLGFSPRVIVDGPGPDFIVFENPFYAGGDPLAPVAELGTVSVSVDGEEWHEFSCEPGDAPPYPGCAGWTPVVADVTAPEGESPFDPEKAGGEAFDLSDLGLDEVRFVRITDIEGDNAVFDLDAVSIVNGRCE